MAGGDPRMARGLPCVAWGSPHVARGWAAIGRAGPARWWRRRGIGGLVAHSDRRYRPLGRSSFSGIFGSMGLGVRSAMLARCYLPFSRS